MEHKALFHKGLCIFRVTVLQTLKTANCLLTNQLRATRISLLMMPGKIEKAEMLPILVRAEECAEKADALYKQMYNFIWKEHESGKSDIAEEDWNGIVRSLEEQAYSYMEKAMGDILEIMWADPGKELWMKLRYDVYDKMNLGSEYLRNMDFYQSGYMEGVTGAAAPINMLD